MHTEMIAENIPNAKLSVIPGDHFIANKNPDEFNKEVEDFLRSVIGGV
ncbi:MAG: alpha/beta hydrolase [Lachnospiraceae bacterium]|nr:alpha/beta hydrolase [Lachnospiraceae bacterium]